MGFKLAELFVPIRIDQTPMSKGLALAHRGLLGLTAAATQASFSVRGAFLGLVGVAAPVGYAVKQAIDLEHQYGQIRKTTGLVGDEFDRLRKGLRELATTMAGVSLDEVNGIAEMAGRLGIQGVDGLLSYTRAIASIKIALDDIPVEEAATSIARILNVFHLGPEAALSFASALNKLDDSSTATGRDILDVAQRLSGSAATLGLTPQKVLALAAALKDAGVENEVGGSAFSQILAKMAVDTTAFAKVAGVATKEFAATLRRDPLEALKLLIAGLAKMEKLERFKALDQLGFDGVRTAGSLLQLSQVIGRLDGMVEDANGEWRSHASIEREVAIRAKETGAQLQLLWNNVRLTAAGVGDLLLPVIQRLAGAFGEVAEAVRASVASQEATISPWIQALIDQVDTLGVVWRNWGDIVELVGVRVAGQIDYVETVLSAFAGWVGNQFVNVIVDALSMIGNFAENEFLNLVLIAKEAFDVIASGFAKPFAPKLFDAFEGIVLETEGFVMPERDPVFDQLQRQIEDRMMDRERQRLDDRAKRGAEVAAGKAPAGKKGAEGEGKAPAGKGKKAESEDLAAYIKRLGEGVFGKDDTKKLVDLGQQQLGVQRQQLEQMRKPKPGQAAVAVGPA